MPSPFPGMDPYLEAHWRDIHARLITYASDALQGVLPRSLRAHVEERVIQQPLQGIVDLPRLGTQVQAGFAVVGPILVETEPEFVTETFLEIIDRESGNRVVTVIEFLSPSNKSPGSNHDQYLRKQHAVCSSATNLVEIDLNRFGTHSLAFHLRLLDQEKRTPYMASVRRAGRGEVAEVYPMPLWERLPIIKIPLRADDADVPLDVQALVDQCYRNGGYEGTLDYAIDPDPPLSGADEVWADAYLHEKGLRTQKKPPRPKRKPKSR